MERGFSVNKTLVISLVSQRVIHDHMNANNLLPHILEVTALLRRHIRSSRQRYQQHLDDQIKKNVSNEKQLTRNALNDQIDTVKENKRTLVNTINELHTHAYIYISQNEGCSSLAEIKSLLAKSNSLRKTAKEKEQEVMTQ